MPSQQPRGRRSREDIYRQLDDAVADLRTRLGGLPSPTEAEDIWGNIWFQEAHNSTAIEGNTLVLREVELLLSEGRAVGDKQLAEYLEVRGYADAAEWVYQQGLAPGEWSAGDLITLTEVRHVHRVAMAKVWEEAPHPDATPDEGPGGFRRHGIRAFPGGMQPPDWPAVPALMSDWVAAASALRSVDRPLPEAIAGLHARFEQIHPFLDGNGRAGRLLHEPAPDQAWISTCHRSQGGSIALLGAAPSRRPGGSRTAGRVPRARRHGHSHAVHRPGRGWARQVGATRGPGR